MKYFSFLLLFIALIGRAENPISPLKQRVYDLAVKDHHVFLAVSAGLVVLELNKDFKTRELSHIVLPGAPYSLRLWKNYLFLFNGPEGFYIIDVQTPKSPKLLKQIQTAGAALNGEIMKETLFVADGTNGVSIYTLKSLPTPRKIGHIPSKGYTRAIQVQNQLLFMADGPAGLRVFDLADLHRIRAIAAKQFPTDLREILVDNHILYVGTGNNTLYILKFFKKNRAIELVIKYPVTDIIRHLTLNSRQKLLYLALSDEGLWKLDLSDLARPKTLFKKKFKRAVNNVVLSAGHIFIPNDDGGLKIIKD